MTHQQFVLYAWCVFMDDPQYSPALLMRWEEARQEVRTELAYIASLPEYR